MDKLKYKGFTGSVGFSEADKVYYGKIEGTTGLVNYEGGDLPELETAFHEAVEDYLIFCREENLAVQGCSEPLVDISLSLTQTTNNRLAALAENAGKSLSSFVSDLIEKQAAAML